MSVFGRRRGTEADTTPEWILRYFVHGEVPERGTLAWRQYVYGRFFTPVPQGYLTLGELFERHRAAIDAERKRLGRRGGPAR